MTNPQIDTRAEIESALQDFRVFIDMGVLVHSLTNDDADRRVLGALNLVLEEFQDLSNRILAA